MPLRKLAKWLRWSNTPQAWQERFGILGILAAALSLWYVADVAPPWVQALGWASLALLLAFFSRRGWLKLFGPVLFYDLIRNARRTHFFVYRIMYLGVLLFLLCWMYLNWRPHHELTEPVTANDAAELALLFFSTFMVVQLVFVIVLTPAFTASAIAEEKERKTIDFILATDLRNREIVFGKLLSRMAMLSMFILAGLPVLSALQFMGGFSPRSLLVGFAATMVTIVSLASLTLLASVLARRTREALLLAYIILVAYFGATVLAHIQLRAGYGNTFPSTEHWESPVTLGDVMLGIRAGNPVFAVQSAMPGGNFSEDGLVRALGSYATFHGLLALACIGASIVLVRRVSLQVPRTPRPVPSTPWRRWRPALGLWPMIWKEVWAERVKRRWLVVGGMLFLMVLSFLPVAFMLADYYRPQSSGMGGFYWDPWARLGEEINQWVRSIGTLVALLGLAGVGVRAATSIRGEHDKDTMTSLLLSPLTSEEILFGKWLGSITSARWFVVWLGLLWGIGVVFNGLSPFAVPLLAIACLCYAGAAASLGLWCSVVCRTSLRAILATLVLGLILFAGHWIPWMCCVPLHPDGGSGMEFVLQMQGAITPPAVLAGYLPDSPSDLERFHSDPLWNPIWLKFIGISGAGLWGLFAWFVWLRANQRFKKEGGRMDHATRSRFVPTDADRRRFPLVPGIPHPREHADKLRAQHADRRIAENTDSTG
jgi:ABC-type transport system involved in multi-copper enzyme maturation permease subunit